MRPASTRDASEVAAVHVRAWRAGYGELLPGPVLDGLSVGVRRRAWEERIDDGAHPTLVAEDEGGAVAGFCTLADGEIAALYVDPDRWRQGIGSALLGAALELLRDGGASEAKVWLLAGNDPARRLYERHGFVADGAEKREPIASLPAGEAPPQIRMRAAL